MSEEKKTLLISEIIDLDLVNYHHLDGFVVPIKSFYFSFNFVILYPSLVVP